MIMVILWKTLLWLIVENGLEGEELLHAVYLHFIGSCIYILYVFYSDFPIRKLFEEQGPLLQCQAITK